MCCPAGAATRGAAPQLPLGANLSLREHKIAPATAGARAKRAPRARYAGGKRSTHAAHLLVRVCFWIFQPHLARLVVHLDNGLALRHIRTVREPARPQRARRVPLSLKKEAPGSPGAPLPLQDAAPGDPAPRCAAAAPWRARAQHARPTWSSTSLRDSGLHRTTTLTHSGSFFDIAHRAPATCRARLRTSPPPALRRLPATELRPSLCVFKECFFFPCSWILETVCSVPCSQYQVWAAQSRFLRWLRWAWWLGPKGGRVEGRRTSRAVTAASRVCGLVGTRAGQHGPTNLGRARGHHAVGVLWALTSPRRHPRRLPELSRVCDPSRPCTYACAGSRRASAVCAPLPGARASPAACVDGCSGRTDEAADCPWHLPRR